MRIKKHKGQDERRILTAMILDDNVLGRIHAKWHPEIFRSKQAKLISRWCIDYFSEYLKAPAQGIIPLYESWERKTKDADTSELVAKFLDAMSSEFEEQTETLNSEFIIDLAGKYFTRVQIEQLRDDVEASLDSGNAQDAHKRITAYRKIEMGIGSGIDVFRDKDAILQAFRTKEKSLIQFQGALGQFYSTNLGRGDFVSFLGRKKIGKSFYLMDIAFRAALSRLRVAYFECGDMGQDNTIKRLCERASRHPKRPGTYEYPTDLVVTQKNGPDVGVSKKTFDKGLNEAIAIKAFDRLIKKKLKSNKVFLKLSCHANDTLSVDAIQSTLDEWSHDNFIPDVIVIDYADILKMEYFGIEGRDKINKTWKQLRRLSQERHALVITATQADAASFDQKTVNMSNFSEDNRKFDHITGMIGINQTVVEKRMGVTRLNWIALRDDEFDSTKCVYVAGCLAIAAPTIISCWKTRTNKRYKKKKK